MDESRRMVDELRHGRPNHPDAVAMREMTVREWIESQIKNYEAQVKCLYDLLDSLPGSYLDSGCLRMFPSGLPVGPEAFRKG